MDGALTDNIPVLDDSTITVSPFAGESDICPDDLSSHLHHINLAGKYTGRQLHVQSSCLPIVSVDLFVLLHYTHLTASFPRQPG